ncbi:8945_t:CDS:2 [Diversispora eburnea]|uniref:8945_t:CDS:1 n=1 Tax=Diversispora eburnea TaxID=1213867 RepID=A0A9N9A7J7_9GLOM|nr:8945_t:CDS:2 [Diversispora eburnea]
MHNKITQSTFDKISISKINIDNFQRLQRHLDEYMTWLNEYIPLKRSDCLHDVEGIQRLFHLYNDPRLPYNIHDDKSLKVWKAPSRDVFVKVISILLKEKGPETIAGDTTIIIPAAKRVKLGTLLPK